MDLKEIKNFIENADNKTQKGLGKALGHGDPTIISKILGGKRALKVNEIAPLLVYTESEYIIFNHVISFKLPENFESIDFTSVALVIAALSKSPIKEPNDENT